MKIYVMTDMEGVAGILDHDGWVQPSGYHFAKGQRLLTAEVNAAVDGLVAGGATEVVVCDGHGAGGIDPELLDERALLLRLVGPESFPFALDASYDAICWVGQHAKAGTDFSHITHTGWFDVIDCTINGLSIGEYGEMALCARELGIPSILACGEAALCREAEALTPGVVTVPVKWGLQRDGLEELTTDQYRQAKLSALHLAPQSACRCIREGALDAMCRLVEDREQFCYPALQPPYVRMTTIRQGREYPPKRVERRHEDSVITLLNIP
jgi:D-amino peptidase